MGYDGVMGAGLDKEATGFTHFGWTYLRSLTAVSNAVAAGDRHAEERAFDEMEVVYPDLTNDDREILRSIGYPVGLVSDWRERTPRGE